MFVYIYTDVNKETKEVMQTREMCLQSVFTLCRNVCLQSVFTQYVGVNQETKEHLQTKEVYLLDPDMFVYLLTQHF